MDKRSFPLRMVAWELTRNCNLTCAHCRARAGAGPHGNELSFGECAGIIDDIAAFSTPTIILTGGEPLLRPDIYDIAAHVTSRGLRAVIAVNGTLVDREKAEKLKTAGIVRVSISIDGKDRISHDVFRGVPGSFDAAMRAARTLGEAGLPFQINTTITRLNACDLAAFYDLVREIGAAAWHVFLLVPVGRGEGLRGEELNAAMYEDVLNWLYEREEEDRIEIKVTCAPHYYRIVKERGGVPKSAGCLAGKGFLFISHTGVAQPCGYLELACGDVRKDGVRKVWEDSPEFGLIRDLRGYKGKCGRCQYLAICGGCRARAKELKGDLLEAEPYCSYGGE
ncbi:MAG: radical SAM protein [Syntrophorhabdales bacterium]|jgi:radical SAM protein with 4Fe4S-binding SPASM domain